jgi:membrane protease YdiL (CAAX protease family)
MMSDLAPWRLLLPALLACAAAWGLDAACARRGLLPPGFGHPARRALGFAAVALVFFQGVFLQVGLIGLDVSKSETDLSTLNPVQLFALHALLVVVLLVWFLAGFAGVRAERSEPAAAGDSSLEEEDVAPLLPPTPPAPAPSLPRRFAEQFGFVAPAVGKEVGIGLVLGLGAWLGVLAVAMLLGLAVYALGGEELLPKKPPEVVPWIAGLPIALRLLLSLSAGVVEETFFRGFLQPRIGLLASSALFVLAHASYGQPFLLVGVTLLSLIYGLLVRWRQSLWAAITAHVLFDAVQLLVVIPAALRMVEGAG